MSIMIHFLTNSNYLGDKNQALGIQTAIEKKFANQLTISREWNDNDPEKLKQLETQLKNDSENQHVLIAIGEHGIHALQELQPAQFANVLSVYASHQVLPDMLEKLDQVHLIALPAHVIDQRIRQKFSGTHQTLIETIGVAHNLSSQELNQAYKDWQTSPQKIIPSQTYMGVILGGDAPKPDGSMRFFTPDKAKALGSYLIELYQQKNHPTLLIANSPRTGKFDPETKKELKVHTGEAIDKTTQALLQELDANHIPYQFFDFIAGKPSAYKPILYALQKTPNSIAVVTGDSTSMVTEIGDSLPGRPLYVINVNSMNEAHVAHVQSVNQSGYAYVVRLADNQHKTYAQPPAPVVCEQRETAAGHIANAIDRCLREKNPVLFAKPKTKLLQTTAQYLPKVGWLFFQEKGLKNTPEPTLNESCTKKIIF